jgi:Tol biopolymer transport system component
MNHTLTFVALVAATLVGCTGGGTTASVAPGESPGSATPEGSPGALGSAAATATATLSALPTGRILFHRVGSDGVEHYFTIKTDGTDEQALFTAEGCGCAHWSADGTQVFTLSNTGHGTFSFTTIRPDGTNRVVLNNPINTLNLAPGASSADGRRIAFAGWDETDPSHNGLYIASPDLTDLRLVMRLPKGMLAVEPFGVTREGSKIAFFGETGPDGDITHAGDVYVVNSDGSGLRKLNPQGTKIGSLGMPTVSLSPDGRRAAFGVDDAVFVIDLDSGEVRQITDRSGFVWAVSWSPTGEWIAYTRQHGTTSVISLVRPDGTDQKEISAKDGSDETAGGAWSPKGDALLVRRGTDARHDLWIMDLDGKFIAQVTHEPSSYGTYSWAPVAGS